MSGLEAIGIAASLIQVAELGTKLSVKLFSFYRELKGANESIQDLSNDVAITSAILYELGESLKEDEQAKLYSKKAFGFLQDVLNQCEEVIQQIRDLTKYNESTEKTRLQQITDMFRQVILEPRLDPLKASLKRLKSRMLLLLNVIMYAGQLRSNNSPKMLQEQREFIKILLEEEQKIKVTTPIISHPVTINASTDSQMITLKSRVKDQTSKNDKPSDLDEYSLLMQRMLQEINSCKSRLRESRYSRIKSGVLNIHSREILQFQLDHGQSILQHFDNSLFAEDIQDGSSETISETGSLGSPNPDPKAQRVAAEKQANPKASASLDSEDADNRSPPLGETVFIDENESPSPNRTFDIEPFRPIPTVDGLPALKGLPHDAAYMIHHPLEYFSNRKTPIYSDGRANNPSESSGEILPSNQTPLFVEPVRFETTHPEGTYRCNFAGCKSPPFQTQYFLNSHRDIHGHNGPLFCPVESCSRSNGGKGFKRKNEMLRHALLHSSDARCYVCPFCSDKQHLCPRPDNLIRHVRVHHPDKTDDPILHQTLAQRPMAVKRARKSRIVSNDQQDVSEGERPVQTSSVKRQRSEDTSEEGPAIRKPAPPALSCGISTDQGTHSSIDPPLDLTSIQDGLKSVQEFGPPGIPLWRRSSRETAQSIVSTDQLTGREEPFQTPFMEKVSDGTETLEMLVLQWTNLRPEEIPA